ncbi:MAG TPA: asparagine synthase C-terminal domain-containing protein, partial [Gemmatimonadaceae bacterium]|nr:asparagine synthase C-terminal domain-containing protein [Gemmatimonadaceae bacterium]
SPGHADDESAGARATARELGIEHRVLELAGDHSPDIARLTAAFAEPFACDSALGMLSVSETIAGAGIKVLLTGDGGDDVFLGYPRHRHLRAAQLLAALTPSAAAEIWSQLRPQDPRRARGQRAVHFLDYATGGLPAFLDAHEGLPEFARRGILGERLQNVRVSTRGRPWSSASARRLLSDYLAHDWQSQFVSEYLTKVDGATMYHALEARSPLLDQELWEWAASLPLAHRMRGWRLKSILRDIAARRVSRRLATLPKKGFGVPVLSWLGAHRQKITAQYLRDSMLAAGGWIQVEPLLRELEELPPGRQVSRQLWYAVVLESWMRAERDARRQPLADAVGSEDTDHRAVAAR